MKLAPFYECARSAEKLVQAGCHIHQKFTCGRCAAVQTMEKPDVFFERGVCEECGHETDLRIAGCNYMVAASGAAAMTAVLMALGGKLPEGEA